MTKKRYQKLTRALLTDIHKYSLMVEGQIAHDGKPLQRTSMLRKNMSPQPDWNVYNSYDEAWMVMEGAWEAVRKAIVEVRARDEIAKAKAK